ncbi:cation diffusion facilitator family transporter [Streptomyces sp. NPDC059175]|uniref:cation diffusion facilitator family transporter n=1 Tax=Streptomyces sp. NPDC059175 TaxID=3346757 RepID=UPI00369E1CCE
MASEKTSAGREPDGLGVPEDAPVPPPERIAPDEVPNGTARVLAAGVADAVVAVAKAAAGVAGGSGAMLAEAAHSAADAVSDVLLISALRRSSRRADEDHPLGYGPEQFVKAALASVAVYAGAAVFAVYDGVSTLMNDTAPGNPLVSYLVLALAGALQGCSLWTGARQHGGTAPFGPPARRLLRHGPGPAVRSVTAGDLTPVAGLLIAACGLAGAQLSGSAAWDGSASVLIGVLLGYAAWDAGRRSTGLSSGRTLPPRMRESVHEELLTVPHIVGVVELTALVQGPDGILIAAKVNFRDVASAEQVEWACEDAEEQLRQRFPEIRRVYLDPTPAVHRVRPDAPEVTADPPRPGGTASSGRRSEGP